MLFANSSLINSRPIIQNALSFGDKFLESLSWAVLGFIVVYTLSSYANLPEIIPTHFGWKGNPDQWGNKYMILILLIIPVFIQSYMTYLSFYPHKFNNRIDITEENAPKQYKMATSFLRITKLFILLLFTVIIYQGIDVAIGKSEALNSCLILAIISCIVMFTITFTILSKRNK